MAECLDLKKDMMQGMLDTNEDLIQFYMLNYTPLIFINNHIYKGNFSDTLHLVEALCMVFEEPPAQCAKLDIFSDFHDFSSSSLWRYIVYCIATLFGIFIVAIAAFYCLFKRKLRNKMDSELESRINGALMKYYGNSQVKGDSSEAFVRGLNEGLDSDERKIQQENNQD